MGQCSRTMATVLQQYSDAVVSVITCDGRHLVGTLRGFDQMINVILEDCQERVYSRETGVEVLVHGLFVVRGDNIAIVGLLNQEKDARIDLNGLSCDNLNPIVH